VQRFRGGLVCKAHRLCVSLNSRLESNTAEEEDCLGRARSDLAVHAIAAALVGAARHDRLRRTSPSPAVLLSDVPGSCTVICTVVEL